MPPIGDVRFMGDNVPHDTQQAALPPEELADIEGFRSSHLPQTIDCGWALSSAVEHYLDMVGVTGSIPVAPTIRSPEKPVASIGIASKRLSVSRVSFVPIRVFGASDAIPSVDDVVSPGVHAICGVLAVATPTNPTRLISRWP
jgi:hypothetical protein